MLDALLALPLPLSAMVLDDNSPDGTGQIADAYAAQHPGRVHAIHRPGKQGLGAAYQQGFQLALDAGADLVAQMDTDFSHPPAKLVELYQAVEGVDIAIGSRYVAGGSVDEKWPLWRKGLSAFGNFYARTLLQMPIRDCTGGFRVYKRSAVQRMPLHLVRSNGYAYQVETAYIAHLSGLRFTEVPIYFAERSEGVSKMSLRIQIEAALRVWQMRWRFRNYRPAQPSPTP